MIQKNSIGVMLIFISDWLFSPNHIVAQSLLPCDPFDTGTSPAIVQNATTNGGENPNACLCAFPCSVNKVGEFVRFYFTKRGKRNYRELDVKNPLTSKLFNKKRSIKFLIHGYTGEAMKGWMPPTGNQLAQNFNGTVMLLDYGAISNCSYERTVYEIVPAVAYYVANVIRIFNFDPHQIELIGHSIGAHLAGYIGAALNGSIKRITGLDPAGPGYDALNIGLNKSCANFVQVIHTDPGDFGTVFNRGDADFWANNRSELQPGCTFKQCGHGKALFYYFASLFPQNKFFGGNCQQLGVTCSKQYICTSSIFGEVNDGKFGQFCFDTTPCFPYASTLELQPELEHHKKEDKTHNNCKSDKSKSHKRCKH